VIFFIESSLEKLDGNSNGNKMLPLFKPDFGNRMPYDNNPPTKRACQDLHYKYSDSTLYVATVLSRVQAFLPALQASNALLVQRAQADPKSVDIEHIEEGMEQYIEMVRSLLSLDWSPFFLLWSCQDLGLGVFEDRSHLNNTRNATSDSDSGTSKSSVSASEDTDTDSDTDSTSSDEIITAFKPIRPIKPLPRRKLANRPDIVLLGEHS
jgi:hypothetical protein